MDRAAEDISVALDAALALLRQNLDVDGPQVSLRVDHATILRFVNAIGDLNPLYRDEEYAASTSWGGVIAPPMFLAVLRPKAPMPTLPFGRTNLNGGNKLVTIAPVRPGQTVTARARIVTCKATHGRSGPLLIINRETRYELDDGQLLGSLQTTVVRR